MDSPHLPKIVACNFRRMVYEKLLSEHEKNFFTDSRLSKFWECVDKYLSNLPADSQDGASAFLIGSFITPLVLYGKTGTAENPSPKINTLNRLMEIDQLLDNAGTQAAELSKTLLKLKVAGEFIPFSALLSSGIYSYLDQSEIERILSLSDRMAAYEAIDLLWESIMEHERARGWLNDVPGMKSNKSSWRDWLAEARSNIGRLLRIYPGEFKVREADWVALAKILIDENISRESVRDALRKQ